MKLSEKQISFLFPVNLYGKNKSFCEWRREELGITKAKDLIEPLKEGLFLMKSNPAKFETLNPKNGWGSYRDFIPWIEKYIDACVEHPDADVRVSR